MRVAVSIQEREQDCFRECIKGVRKSTREHQGRECESSKRMEREHGEHEGA